MTLPAAWTTALALPGVSVDLWLELEGAPWAFGLTARAASWYAGRTATEQRLGVKGLLSEIPRGVEQRARPLDGDSSIGELVARIVDDGGGLVRALCGNAGRTDHTLQMMAPAHAISTAYALHDTVTRTDITPDEWVLRCSTAGTSGATAPNPAPTVAVGDTVADGAGTLVWTVIGKVKDLGATGSETFLPYLGTADAAQYPAAGGTIYLGRETCTYTARTAGTNGAGYFAGVTRGMYALPGRTTKTAHVWGDEITPYMRTVATRRAQLLATLDGTDANRLARWGGTVQTVTLAAGLHTYELTMGSLDGELAVDAFAGQRTAKLSAGIVDGSGAYTVKGSSEPAAETSKVRLLADSMAGTWSAGQTIMIRVGEEFFAGTLAVDATGTYVDFSGTGARSLFSTSAESHQVGEEIAEVVWTGAYDAAGTAEYRFSKFTQGDHPFDVLLSFLLSREGDGANGTYDILPAGWGLGLDQARVDIAGIEKLARDWLPGQRHLWLYTEPFGMQEEIAALLRPHLCFPVTTLGDQLTVRRLSPPIEGATVRAITASTIVDVPSWDANIRDVIGLVNWLCDYDPLGGENRQKFVGPFTDAQRNYAGQWQTITVEAKGAFTGNDPGAVGFFGAALQTGAAEASLRYVETIRDRYSMPLPIIGVECSYDCLDVEPGDLVRVTCEHLPDTTTGGVGLTSALCEVLSKQIDDHRGVVTLSVLHTVATAARLIAPAEAVTVTAAGVIKVADAAGLLYAAGIFAATDVIEVWTSDLLTSRGTAALTGVTDGGATLDLAMATVPAGTTAGDVVTIAAYDSATASQRARFAFLADAAGTLGAGADPAHQYAI